MVRARTGLEGDPRARELAEAAERSKWVQELRDIVVTGTLRCSTQVISATSCVGACGVGGGRRACHCGGE